MENLSKQRDSWLAWTIFVSVILALSLSLTACGKKKNGGSASGGGGSNKKNSTVSCSGCKGYSDELVAAWGRYGTNLESPDIEMAFTVYAPGSSDDVGAYNGDVGAKGYVHVYNNPFPWSCDLPEGAYTLSVEEPNGSFSTTGVFPLSNLQMTMKHKKSGDKFPVTIGQVDFRPNSLKGLDKRTYSETFYGSVYFCNNTSMFFPLRYY